MLDYFPGYMFQPGKKSIICALSENNNSVATVSSVTSVIQADHKEQCTESVYVMWTKIEVLEA